jgi:Uma2 family endonuclease
MSAQALPWITPEQYLEAERSAEFKSGYFGGQIYAMAGAPIPHAHIIANVTGALFQALRGSTCFVLSSDARLRISASGLYTYPDLMVVCEDPKFADEHRDTVLNPTLIVEVLSKTTEANDRGFKFAQYRKLESFREYALVSTAEPRVEIFLRQTEGQWLLSESVGAGATCHFASLDCKIALSDIYDKITFGAEQPSLEPIQSKFEI